ncbi:NADH dehydrogenase [ubiquinone] 1 alpha subcomplex assembly factor 3, partial [Tremellales sp. Uapishka_1]
MLRSTIPIKSTLSTIRSLHTTTPRLSASILHNLYDTSDRPPLSVAKLTPRGFHLSDGLVVPGGLIFLDGRALLWDVDPPKGDGGEGVEEAWSGWDKDRFLVFEKVVPRPEILLLGTGLRVIPPPQRIKDYVSGLGIQLDVMDSRNAASTFNLLSEEGRTVGAALCPLSPIDPRTGGRR